MIFNKFQSLFLFYYPTFHFISLPFIFVDKPIIRYWPVAIQTGAGYKFVGKMGGKQKKKRAVCKPSNWHPKMPNQPLGLGFGPKLICCRQFHSSRLLEIVSIEKGQISILANEFIPNPFEFVDSQFPNKILVSNIFKFKKWAHFSIPFQKLLSNWE
jgi:hypothetical protein